MLSRLDRLLDAIGPEKTLDCVGARVDAAMNSFRLRPQGVKSWGWDEFEDFMGRYFEHVICAALTGRPSNGEPHGHFCAHAHVLEEEYGPKWKRIVLKLVRTGAEGGLFRMLRASATRLAEHWTRNRVRSLVSEYWQSLSERERRAVPREYLEKCGALLSPETRKQLSYEPWFNFDKVLEQHPYLVDRVRRLL